MEDQKRNQVRHENITVENSGSWDRFCELPGHDKIGPCTEVCEWEGRNEKFRNE